MRSYHMLAWKEILGQKVVSVLILIAIILSTLMTTAVGQSVGVLDAMRRQQAVAIGGDRYVSFVQLTEEQARIIEEDDRLSYAGRFVQLGSMDLNDLLKLNLEEYWGAGLGTYPSYTKIEEGRLPEKAMEVALPEDALQFLGFTGKIGDTVTLPLSKALRHGIEIESYDYEADFVLVGILQSNYLGYTYGYIRGFAGEGTAAEILPQRYLYYNMDIRTIDQRNFQKVIEELSGSLGLHELDTLYNRPYLNALGIRYSADEDSTMLDDDGFPFVILAGVLAAALILLAAGLVIYNILKIAVTRRIGQYGVLRAIGAGKGQLYRIVAGEIFLLCLCGVPVGMLCGFLSAKGILGAVLSQLSPEMFLASDTAQLQGLIAANSAGKWAYLLVSGLITLLFAFLAAAPAAYFAAKVAPVTAMSGVLGTTSRTTVYTEHFAHGSMLPGRRMKDAESRGKGFRAKAERNYRRGRIRSIHGFERYYAALNMQRNKSRTAITILSLVMSITVFVALQSYLSHLNVTGVEAEHLGDYSIVNEYTGFSPKELSQMEADANVAAVGAQQCTLYEPDEQYEPIGIETDINFAGNPVERFQIYGANDCWVDYCFKGRLTQEQLSALKAGEGCVVRNPLPIAIEGFDMGTTCVEEDSTITIAGKKLRVLLALNGYDDFFSVGNNGFCNGVQVLVSDRLYPQLTGAQDYAEFRPVLNADADRETFEQTIDNLCTRAAGTTWVSYEETDRQLAESGAQIRLLAWGLILLIGLIGILNIVNTVYTNIHTRVAEIGTQRAIGMSAGSLYRTFLWEGAYYGIAAAVIGSVAGTLCTVLVEAAGTGAVEWTVPPVTAIAEASVCSIAACLLATAIPLRRIAKMSIVESIEAME